MIRFGCRLLGGRGRKRARECERVWDDNERRKEIAAGKGQKRSRTGDRKLCKEQNGRDEVADEHDRVKGWKERVELYEGYTCKWRYERQMRQRQLWRPRLPTTFGELSVLNLPATRRCRQVH